MKTKASEGDNLDQFLAVAHEQMQRALRFEPGPRARKARRHVFETLDLAEEAILDRLAAQQRAQQAFDQQLLRGARAQHVQRAQEAERKRQEAAAAEVTKAAASTQAAPAAPSTGTASDEDAGGAKAEGGGDKD